MVKSHIWHLVSAFGICSPSQHKLILAHRPEEIAKHWPVLSAIIELNPKERMGVNKSDSYIGCRRKNVKRPFGTKNVCEEADRFRILVQFFPVCPFRRTYSGSSLPNSSPALSWLSGDDKLRSGVGGFQQSGN